MEDSALITGDEEGDDQNDGSPAASTSYVEFPRGRLLDFKPSLTSILLNSWISSYRSILGLFNAPRPISTVLLIYLLYGLASRTEVLLPQYTSLLLAWPLATVNKVMALKALVSAVILFLLPTVRSSYLQPRMTTAQIDLFITKGSLVTNMIGVIGMGFSAPAGFFILSLCVYTSGIGLADSLVAYGTLILPPGPQVSEFFVWTGLIDTIATLIGAPLWSAVFSIILRSERLALGLPFWISAGLFGAGVAGVMGLQRR
ncbi:MAG: hypothetical protein LQ352_004674 [Teloschistes flavicans]|nr:MAG: hypothetical protein LQ352_004674 [Teloschistes flavicans]